ncbi:Flp pilus assembly protein TadD [Bradyrhizobium sp. LB7.2]
MSKRLSVASPPARFLFSALLILALGGCQTTGIEDITGALGGKSEMAGRLDAKPDAKPDMDALRERYRAKPGDPNVALEYGKALRQTGQRAQALAVLEQAVLAHSTNKAGARRLWPRARRQRQFPAGVRRPRSRAFA